MIAHTLLFAMGVGRCLLGLAPFVAAGPSARLMGFPMDQNSPSARLMGRFFGVRDVGLGVLVFYALTVPVFLPFVIVFNALTDVGDLVAISIPLLKREGINRAALRCAAFAMQAAVLWFVMYWWTGAQPLAMR